VLTTIATVWFVAVQWEPDSSTAIGGVLLVSGLALIAIPLVDDPIRAAMKARKSSGATPEPPPPVTPAT
jgi:peptidoglycan/LPS O-acetylase OafA/YrhL